MNEIKTIDDSLDNAQLVCIENDGITKYDFSNFTFLSKLASKICSKNLTLQEAEDNQQELKILINKLNNDYNPRNPIKINEKDDTLKSAKNCFLPEKTLLEHLREVFFRTQMDLKWKKNQMKNQMKMMKQTLQI